jgi:phage/plasmid-like protein (TIGR03299 family)
MAHLIDQQTGKPAIAFVETEGTPWHGLGVPVQQAMTAKEAIELGSLNWEVKLENVFTQDQKPIDNVFSVVRQDTRYPLGVVRTRYTVLQNNDAFDILDSLVENGLRYHVIGSLDNGRKIWLLAKLPGQIRVIGHDVVDKYLLLSNSHDGTQTLRIAFTPIRVVCNNTLTMAQNDISDTEYLLNVRHTKSMSKSIAKAKDLFIDLEKRSKEFEENAKRLVCYTLVESEIEKFLYGVLGYSKVKEIEKIPTRTTNVVQSIMELHQNGKGSDIVGVRGSLWGIYNAVVEYADYQASVKGQDKEASRLNSTLFGNLSKLKDKAYEKALELVAS